jgi:hypothetical protein
MTVSRWSARLSGAAAAICVIIGGIVYATIPDASGVIHACYSKSTSAIRIIDDSVTNCKSGETSLQWNVAGPIGPQGPAGAQGLQGPQGDPGNTNVLTQSVTTNTPGATDSKTLDVPGLGTINLSCTGATGVASASVTSPVPFQGRNDNGGAFSRPPGTLNLTPVSPLATGELWITTSLSGVWRVNFVVDNLIVITPPIPNLPNYPCIAAVTVTVI